MKLLTTLLIFIAISAAFSQVQTRGGKYSASYTASDPFVANRGIERTKTVRVNFAVPFTSTPKVAVALYSFNVNYGDAGVIVEPDDIELDHFTFKIIAPEGARVNSVGVQWIASNSIRINFEYFNVEDPDYELRDEGYSIPADLEFPAQSSSVSALALIAGFQFPGNADPLLHAELDDIELDSASINVWINDDNVPNYVSILVIHFRNTLGNAASFTSSLDGLLYSGSGTRHQYRNLYDDQKNYFICNGIAGFNFDGFAAYRLTHTVSQTNLDGQTRLRYDMATSSTTKVHQTWGSLFYM